jgi:hypothetical protein
MSARLFRVDDGLGFILIPKAASTAIDAMPQRSTVFSNRVHWARTFSFSKNRDGPVRVGTVSSSRLRC